MRLTQVALGVWTATAATWATLTTVVVADDGACLVVDPGITVQEVTALAAEIGSRGWRCVAGFATHPHWDHVLWASALGDAHRTWSQCGWVAKPATQRHPREPNSAASAVTSWTVIPGSTTRHAPSSATTTVVRVAQVAAVAVHTPGATCVSLIARRDTWTLRSPRHQRPRHQRPRPPAPRDRCACAPAPRSGARRRAGRWRSARRRRSRRRGAVVPCVAWPRRVSAARAVVRGQGRERRRGRLRRGVARRRKERPPLSGGIAFGELIAIFQPGVEHLVEERERKRTDLVVPGDADAGDAAGAAAREPVAR